MRYHKRTLAVAVSLALALALLLHLQSRSRPKGRLIVVTPTHARLTRFAQLIKHAAVLGSSPSQVTWIVIEDGLKTDPAVEKLLEGLSLQTVYVARPTTSEQTVGHRGIAQRNAALDYVKSARLDGAIYFSDDDNMFRPELVSELAYLPKDSYTIFPVGNTGYFGLEGPVVVKNESGSSLIDYWCCDYCSRRWNVDMAGFAFHSSLLGETGRIELDASVEPGLLETSLLERIEMVSGSQFVLSDRLLHAVHAWHDYSETFSNVAAFDPSWQTATVYAMRPKGRWDVVRGFKKANDTLPLSSSRWTSFTLAR